MIRGPRGERYYKLALHLHTTNSDGALTPLEVARKYKAEGYDAIAFTDHWFYNPEGEIEGVKIISGCEYNLGVSDTVEGVLHIVGLGMKCDPCCEKSDSKEEVIRKIRAAGGIAVLAHPGWSLNPPSEYLEVEGYSATEIYNAVSDAGESLRPYSDYFADLVANGGKYPALLATDDAHYYDGSDDCRGFVMLKAEGLTREAITQAIENSELFASQGPEVFVYREGNSFRIETSPASVIGIVSSLSWSKGRVLRGEGITHFEYTAKDERWLRVEVRDAEGRRAYSRFFVL